MFNKIQLLTWMFGRSGAAKSQVFPLHIFLFLTKRLARNLCCVMSSVCLFVYVCKGKHVCECSSAWREDARQWKNVIGIEHIKVSWDSFDGRKEGLKVIWDDPWRFQMYQFKMPVNDQFACTAAIVDCICLSHISVSDVRVSCFCEFLHFLSVILRFCFLWASDVHFTKFVHHFFQRCLLRVCLALVPFIGTCAAILA